MHNQHVLFKPGNRLLFTLFLLVTTLWKVTPLHAQDLLWARQGGTRVTYENNDEGRAVVKDASGNTYVTGSYTGQSSFDGTTLTPFGKTDVFIAKYNQAGALQWVKGIGGQSADAGYSIATDGTALYITGAFRGTADFDPSAATANLTTAGSDDIFVARYDMNGNYTWAKSIGGTDIERSRQLIVNATGLYLVGDFKGTADFDPSAATSNLTSVGVEDVFMAKYDLNGNHVWSNKIGGNQGDFGYGIATDGTALYITGGCYGSIDFDPSAATAMAGANQEMFMASYTLNGNYLWAKTTTAVSNGYARGYALAVNATGIYVAGAFNREADFDPSAATVLLSHNDSYDNIFVARYDLAGNYNWAFKVTSSHSNQGNSIAVNASTVYVTGRFSGTADFDPSTGTANLTTAYYGQGSFIASYGLNGNYIWAKQLGGTSSSSNKEEGYAVAVDGSGVTTTGLFTAASSFGNPAATTLSSAGAADIFVATYDVTGNYLWAKRAGNGKEITAQNEATQSAADANGNVYVTGRFQGDMEFGNTTLSNQGSADVFIAKYDAAGTLQWVKNVGGTGIDYGAGIAADATGVYIIGSFMGTADFDPSPATAILSNSGSFFLKLDPNGNYLWVNSLPASHIAAFNSGIYISGSFGGTIDFDPSAGVANLVSGSSSNTFIARYDSNGNYVWAKGFGGAGSVSPQDMAIDATGIFLEGGFSSTVDFDPSAATANLTAAGYSNIFIAKYDLNGNYSWAKNIAGSCTFNGIAANSTGVYVTGYFSGIVDFDPSAAVANLTAQSMFGSAQHAVIAGYDQNGNYLWAKSIANDSPIRIAGEDIAADNSGIYVMGYFGYSSDFDPSAATAILTTTSRDMFLAKYDLNCNYIWATGQVDGRALPIGKGYMSIGANEVYVTGSIGGKNLKLKTGAFSSIDISSIGDLDVLITRYAKSNPAVVATSVPVPAGPVFKGSQNNPLYILKLSTASTSNTISNISFNTYGDYYAGSSPYSYNDIVPGSWKLRYSTDATLDASDPTLATQDVVVANNTFSFTGFSQPLPAGTVYLFVTVDIAISSFGGHTMHITPVNTGTALPAGGVQTIVTVVYADASMAVSGDGWTAATAKKTISEAVAMNLSGISIAPGIYNETVVVDRNLFIVNIGTPSANTPQVRQITMNGAGKTLTINTPVAITDKLVLQAGTVASNGNLRLLSTASQTALIDDFSTGNTGNITGNITAQRFINAPGTRYVSTPVSGVRAGDFGQYQMASYYNEQQVTAASTSLDAGWMNIANSTVIDPIKGLSALYDPARTVNLTGTANTGSFSTTVTRTNSGNFTGFNVLGNPYPSPVRWSAIWNLNNNTNIHKTVYVWNNAQNRSAAYNFATNTSANGGSDEIAQGQAFRIRVNTVGYSTTFSLNNSVRMATSSNNFLRKETVRTSEKLRLVLSSSTNKEGYETVIHSVDDATAGIDAAYDGEFIADKGVDVIYSKAENTNLTINALPELKGERTVALGVEVQQAGMYTIAATEIENFAPATAIYLEDRKLGKLVDLTKEAAYSVQLNKPEANRFFVHFNSTAKQEAASTSFVNVYAEDGEVTVQFSNVKAAKGTIAIVNMLGETVAELNNEQQVAKLRVNQPAGTYMVKIQGENGLTVKKVILH